VYRVSATCYPSPLLVFRRSAETKADRPTDQTGTIHKKSMAGPMMKSRNLKATNPAIALINNIRMRFQVEPVILPNPSQRILHQSGPLSGNVRRMNIKSKITIERRADSSSIKCNGRIRRGTTTRPIATWVSRGLSLGIPIVRSS
jgi:hypothetical protein